MPERTLFWTATDLEAKLLDFQHHYSEHRTHAGRNGHPPLTCVKADHSRANPVIRIIFVQGMSDNVEEIAASLRSKRSLLDSTVARASVVQPRSPWLAIE